MLNAQAWSSTPFPGEDEETRAHEKTNWTRYITTLDTAILRLIGENDIAEEGVPTALDDILQFSLWQRRLNRRGERLQAALKAGLVSRAKHTWKNSDAVRRKGYFLAGVGLETGHALDVLAPDGNALLIGAILIGEPDRAIAVINALSEPSS